MGLLDMDIRSSLGATAHELYFEIFGPPVAVTSRLVLQLDMAYSYVSRSEYLAAGKILYWVL